MQATIAKSATGLSLRHPEARVSAPLRFLDTHFGSAEMDLLLACCRWLAGGMDDDGFLERVEAPFDENTFFNLCTEHRLVMVVHKVLIRRFGIRFSANFINRFERQSLQIAHSELKLGASMLEIHRVFSAAKIRHLFLKGPVLNRILFGEEMLRYSRDLDVLIEPQNLIEADAHLREAGFHPTEFSGKSVLPSPVRRIHRKDITYLKNGIALELHWKTDHVETIVKPALFDWRNQISYCRFQNESLPILPDLHYCLYLCLHAARHDWSRLRWLLDIPLLMQKRGIERDELLALADHHGLRNPVQEALGLSKRLFKLESGNCGLDPTGNFLSFARRHWIIHNIRSPKLQTLALVYRKGFLYPSGGLRAGFWIMWLLGQTFNRLAQAKARIRSLLPRPPRPTQ